MWASKPQNLFKVANDDLSEAIGLNERLILELCGGQSNLRRIDIERMTPLTSNQVRAALTHLRSEGLAVYEKQHWMIAHISEVEKERLAETYGTAGNGQARIDQHAHERAMRAAGKIVSGRVKFMASNKRMTARYIEFGIEQLKHEDDYLKWFLDATEQQRGRVTYGTLCRDCRKTFFQRRKLIDYRCKECDLEAAKNRDKVAVRCNVCFTVSYQEIGFDDNDFLCKRCSETYNQ